MDDLVRLSACQLVDKMRTGETGAVEVLNAHVRVIEASNPDVNALVTLCLERALDEAKSADRCSTKTKSTNALLAGLSREGLPIGLQIIGPPNSDLRLLQLAYGFEQASRESNG